MIYRMRIQRKTGHAIATLEDANGDLRIAIVCRGLDAALEASRVAAE